MGCCFAVAFMISLVRRAWFAVFPGRVPDRAPFAPPAFRSAPGDAPIERGVEVATPPRSGGRVALGVALVGAGLGSLTHGFGLIDTPDAVLPHALFHGTGLVVLAAGLPFLTAPRATVVPEISIAAVTA